MIRIQSLALVLMVVLAVVLGRVVLAQPALGDSICARMQAQAQRLPASAWAERDDPLVPLLQIDAQHADKEATALEQQLAQAPSLREALSVGELQLMQIQRLTGTDIYRAVSVQGSANCEYSAFVQALPGKPWRMLRAPLGMGGQNAPCTTRMGVFAHPYKQAAFVVYGHDAMSSPDRSYEVVPWSGADWAPACRLSLSFRKAYRLLGEFCTDEALCRAGHALAMTYGSAFDSNGGITAPDARLASAAARRALESIEPGRPPDFPMPDSPKSGPNTERYLTNFSNAATEHFVVMVNGIWHVAFLAHAGVGWRESDVTLLGLYLPEDGGNRLRPVAGFQLESVNAGLVDAQVQALH